MMPVTHDDDDSLPVTVDTIPVTHRLPALFPFLTQPLKM